MLKHIAQSPHITRLKQHRLTIPIVSVVLIILIGIEVYAQTTDTIRGKVMVGSVAIGGFSTTEATQRIATATPDTLPTSIALAIEQKIYPLETTAFDLAYDGAAAVEKAHALGRSLNPLSRFIHLIGSRIQPVSILLEPSFDSEKLRAQIATIAQTIDEPGKDIRLHASQGELMLLTDTKTGFIVDQEEAYQAVVAALKHNARTTTMLKLKAVQPTVSLTEAKKEQERIAKALTQPITLTHEWKTFTLKQPQLALWVRSKPEGANLNAHFDEQLISEYVVTIAKELNAEPQAPKITVVDGKVTDFIAPRSGKKLDQTQTITDIQNVLSLRQSSENEIAAATLELPVRVEKAEATDQSAAELGITELIGSATTPFTGSPKNRIANIKNGTKFLSGILIKPGEEFSTLKTLGTVDNTTGYLPELVIKGDRTTPEYGGGLCQVSTTLFRAVLNTGLPVTARQNHSYRVSYYEKDGEGNYIGPGLDATIYQPAPDFKFINDTGHTLLLQGYVVGDKLTFDIYGTKDGRTAHVDGPKKLSETPAGEPIYLETDELKPGEERQVEKPHPGGSAIATYTVTYPDGTKKEQVFKSFYRNWPARFLVGADPNKPADTNQPTDSANPDAPTPPVE